MSRDSRSHIFVNVAYLLLFCFVAEFGPLVVGGFFKLVASLMLACLLAFVVVQSANVYRLLTACLHARRVSLLPLVVDRRWVERSQTTVAVPDEPSLSPLFQRPPPVFSL